jgi:hypothetical protein
MLTVTDDVGQVGTTTRNVTICPPEGCAAE